MHAIDGVRGAVNVVRRRNRRGFAIARFRWAVGDLGPSPHTGEAVILIPGATAAVVLRRRMAGSRRIPRIRRGNGGVVTVDQVGPVATRSDATVTLDGPPGRPSRRCSWLRRDRRASIDGFACNSIDDRDRRPSRHTGQALILIPGATAAVVWAPGVRVSSRWALSCTDRRSRVGPAGRPRPEKRQPPHRSHQTVRSQETTPNELSTEIPNRPSQRAWIRFLLKSSALEFSDHCPRHSARRFRARRHRMTAHGRRLRPPRRWPPPAHRTADRVAGSYGSDR